MERITGKQVQSMMEALHQVYVQPEVEQLDEKAVVDRSANYRAAERRRIEADRRVQAAGGGAKAEAEELARLRAANVKPSGPGSQRWRPASDEALITKARYTVRQRGQEALKNNPDFQAPEKASASAPAPAKPAPAKPAPAPAQTVAASGGAGGQVTVGRKYAATLGGKQGTVTYDASGKKTFTANAAAPAAPAAGGDTKPTTPTGATAADTKPAVPTGTVNGQKFERRLPTMAELRAAQAARAAAKASGGDRAAQEKAAVAGGVQQAQRQASVDAAVKRANSPEVLNRPAPAGSALARQQQAQGKTVSGSGAMGSAANPQVRAQLGLKPINPAPAAAKPVPASTSAAPAPRPQPVVGANNATMKTVGSNLSGSGALNKSVPPEKKKVPVAAGTDLFDIVKGELLDEGYSEQDAMYIMANLDDEQREIVMNEGIGALLKGAVKIGGKLFSRFAKKPGGKSEIAKRAGRVVNDQRAGVMGTDDALNQGQQALDASMSRLRMQDRLGGRAGASLNAKAVERDVRRAAAYGPQTSSSRPFAQLIEPPKPTGSKPGVVKLDKYGNPIK